MSSTAAEYDLTDADSEAWAAEVRRLAAERDAVILAHNYQAPLIQDVADHVGDSLALSRLAASSPASTIVFAGVYFMAETAKILAPDRTVLIPDPRAGCSLADSITAEQLRAWKAEHPGAAVVAYVNTSAEVKAEADLCCTSANAVEIVAALPEDREVLFLPDQFLGAHVRADHGSRQHPRSGWASATCTRASARPTCVTRRRPSRTPSCSSTPSAAAPRRRCGRRAQVTCRRTGPGCCPPAACSTAARETSATAVLVATETGMLHQLRQANPAVSWEPVNPAAVCPYMKMNTPAALLRCLRDGVTEVEVDPDVAERARRAVAAMIEVGAPSAVGE